VFQREENALELTKRTFSLMEKQGYNLKKIRYHRSILNQLVEFCDQRYDGKYSACIGLEFIRHISQRDPSLSSPYFKCFEAEVRRLNHILEGNTERYAFSSLEHYEHSCFDRLVEEYKGYLHETLKSDLDVRMRTRALARFFILLEAHGVDDLEKLEPKDIYNVYINTSDKDMFRKVVRGYLKYAYAHKLLKTDYSAAVPTFTRHVPVPSVYTKEEIELLLSSIDRTTCNGKRNYAILTIFARLGLRSSDIANLRFKNLDFVVGTIHLKQYKTGGPLTLPLTDELTAAIIDYIQHGRAKDESDFVFLTSCAPIRYFGDRTINAIVSRAFSTAGIQTNGRRHGPHSLRSSLATALLDEGNSYPVITEILGHSDPSMARYYVKIDIAHLRECSLPAPSPSGLFANYLSGKEAF
jgi:integrase